MATEKKTLSEILTHRYAFVIREEGTLAHKYTFGFTIAKILAIGFGIFMLLTIFNFFVFKYLVYGRFDQTGGESGDSQVIELAMRVDSLENEVSNKDKFIASFKHILTGNPSDMPKDNLAEGQENTLKKEVNPDEITPIDSALRRQFEDNKDASVLQTNQQRLQNLFLFAPVSGLLMNKFDAKKRHYGVDIVAKKNEPIKAIADGSVIIASWTQDSGHVIGIQHANQLISFYKHNAALLKKVGDFVKAGDLIAIIGDSGELTDGPHLHLEIWHNGNPIDPEILISF